MHPTERRLDMHVESVGHQPQVLDRVLKALTLALVLSIVGFAAYYYYDRRPVAQTSMIDKAIQVAEKAVYSDPQDLLARVALADLYSANGRDDEGLGQYQAALEIQGNFEPAHRGLGLIYLKRQQYAEAEAEFQLVVDARKGGEFAARDSMLQEAYFFLAQAQLGQQRPGDAVPNLIGALKIDKTDADAWGLLGEAQLASGQIGEALQSLTVATHFDPKFGNAYRAEAQAYSALGDEQRSRYALAMAAYSDGQNEQALKDLVAVTQATPDFSDAWTGLGLTLEAVDRKGEAAQAYQQALAIQPNDLIASGGLVRLGQARQ